MKQIYDILMEKFIFSIVLVKILTFCIFWLIWTFLLGAEKIKCALSTVFLAMYLGVHLTNINISSNLLGRQSSYHDFLDFAMHTNKKKQILKIICQTIRGILQNLFLAFAIYFSQIGKIQFSIILVVVMLFWVFPIKNSVFDANLQFQNNYEKRTSVKIKKFIGKSKILTKYLSVGFLLITLQKYYKLNWDQKQIIFALALHYFLMMVSAILSQSI